MKCMGFPPLLEWETARVPAESSSTESRRPQITAERQGEGPISSLALDGARSRDDGLVPAVGLVDESLVFLDQGVEPDTHTPPLGPRQAEQLCRRDCPHRVRMYPISSAYPNGEDEEGTQP
jgi:hypothetical protein